MKALRFLAALAALLLSACGVGSAPVATPAPSAEPKWVGAWAAAPLPMHEDFRNRSLRLIVHPHLGGNTLRIRLSNAQGTAPAAITSVYIAQVATGAALVPGSNTPVTFNGGQTAVSIPGGAELYSDPVQFAYGVGQDLAISLFLSGAHPAPSGHFQAIQTSYSTADDGGDIAAQEGESGFVEITAWYYIAGIDVLSTDARGTVVAVGDSITDGDHSTVSANRRWPDVLNSRVLANPDSCVQSVVNLGIGANQILTGTSAFGGAALLDRLDRDVIAQTDVTDVLILEGTNDIGLSGKTAQQIIDGLTTVAARLHAAGLRVIGCTITPAKNSSLPGHGTSVAVATRDQVNSWIRSTDQFDNVVDFAAAVADPNDPQTLAAEYNSGDGLHPNDAGYEELGKAVDLTLMKGRGCK